VRRGAAQRRRLDGASAAATTIRRKRSVFYNVLGYAAELEELSANSLDRVKWKPPKVAELLSPDQVAPPLAARPYDLRHAAVSLWLNGGVAATDMANRAGHSVEVLLRVYAKCIDGGEKAANRRIDEALAP
jgi:hypothetical protein